MCGTLPGNRRLLGRLPCRISRALSVTCTLSSLRGLGFRLLGPSPCGSGELLGLLGVSGIWAIVAYNQPGPSTTVALADDLQPHVQRVPRLLPRLVVSDRTLDEW